MKSMVRLTEKNKTGLWHLRGVSWEQLQEGHKITNIVKECAEMYSLPICDCCFNFYSPSNPAELSKYWQSDKLHLNADGHQKLIDKLETTLNTLDYYKS